MAVAAQQSHLSKYLDAYLKGLVPPFVDLEVMTAPNQLNPTLRYTLNVECEFDDDPAGTFTGAHLSAQAYMPYTLSASQIDYALLKAAVDSMAKDAAKVLASGEINDRHFKRFRFLGGTIQELDDPTITVQYNPVSYNPLYNAAILRGGQTPPPDNVIDLRGKPIKDHHDVMMQIGVAKLAGRQTDELYVTAAQRRKIQSMANAQPASQIETFYGHKVTVKR